MTVREVTADSWVKQRGLRLTREHPDGGVVDTMGPTPRLSRTPVQPGEPVRGSMDAPDILQEIGLGSELERLLNEDVIAIRPNLIGEER